MSHQWRFCGRGNDFDVGVHFVLQIPTSRCRSANHVLHRQSRILGRVSDSFLMKQHAVRRTSREISMLLIYCTKILTDAKSLEEEGLFNMAE